MFALLGTCHRIFCIFFGGLKCVGHSFANVTHLWLWRDVWIRTQSAAVPSWRATHYPSATHPSNLATSPLMTYPHIPLRLSHPSLSTQPPIPLRHGNLILSVLDKNIFNSASASSEGRPFHFTTYITVWCTYSDFSQAYIWADFGCPYPTGLSNEIPMYTSTKIRYMRVCSQASCTLYKVLNTQQSVVIKKYSYFWSK